MNITIALRSLAGAVLIAAVAAGCGDAQGEAQARVPPPGAVEVAGRPARLRPDRGPHPHPQRRVEETTNLQPEQLRNDDMQDELGHM